MKKIKITCDKCGKTGIKDLKKHLRYCSAESAKVELEIKERTDQPLPDSTSTTSSGIQVEPQQGGIIQEVPKTPITPEAPKPPEAKKEDGSEYAMDYKDVADAVHNSLANLLDFVTKGKAKVAPEDLDRLNRAGAGLLYKYDKNGQLMKYAPEIAYVCTLAGIATEITIQLRKPQ